MAITLDVLNLGEFALDTAATSVAVTTTSAAASGATVIVTGTNLLNFVLTGVADNGPNLTWAIDKQADDSNGNVWIASAYAAGGLASGTTITGTFGGSCLGARSICATSFLGIDSTTAVDTTSGPSNFTTVAAWTTPSTAILAGSLLIACCVQMETLRTSLVTSPSLEAHDFGNGTGFAQTTCYRIESAAASYTVAGTWSAATGTGTCSAVAYKAAADTGQTVLPDADLAAGSWSTAPLYSKLNDSSDATVVSEVSA